MKQNKILSLALVTAGLLSSMPALAVPLTITQSQIFNFDALDDSTSFSFNGFDSSLGILNSVHFEWTMDQTLNNVVINTENTAMSVGFPNRLTATSTTTFSGSGAAILLSDVNTLSTPEYYGLVPVNLVSSLTTTVGTVSKTSSGGKCLSNDNSCGDGDTDLSDFYDLSLLSIALSYNGNQTGSLLPGVYAGYDGYASGTVSLSYDYFEAGTSAGSTPTPTPTPTPEPASFSLLVLGLAGFAASLRKKSICFRVPEL